MNEYLPISCASGSLRNLVLHDTFLSLLDDFTQHIIPTRTAISPPDIASGDIVWVEEDEELLAWDGEQLVSLALKIPMV